MRESLVADNNPAPHNTPPSLQSAPKFPLSGESPQSSGWQPSAIRWADDIWSRRQRMPLRMLMTQTMPQVSLGIHQLVSHWYKLISRWPSGVPTAHMVCSFPPLCHRTLYFLLPRPSRGQLHQEFMRARLSAIFVWLSYYNQFTNSYNDIYVAISVCCCRTLIRHKRGEVTLSV